MQVVVEGMQFGVNKRWRWRFRGWRWRLRGCSLRLKGWRLRGEI